MYIHHKWPNSALKSPYTAYQSQIGLPPSTLTRKNRGGMHILLHTHIYIYATPPRTYVSEAATLLEGILPCCNDLSKEDGRCCWFINNFRFINSQDEIWDVALNYLIRLSLVRSFVIKNPYILDSIDITPNQNFVEYCKFNKIDHKKVMAKAKEQFLDKGLLEIFQYIFF